MCEAANPTNAEACKQCGYIFEENLGASKVVDASFQSAAVRDAGTRRQEISKPVSTRSETTIRQESSVLCRNSLVLLEGTLTLTEKRLMFSAGPKFETGDSQDRPETDSGDLSIPLTSITSVLGKRGMLRPSLTVFWRDDESGNSSKTEFSQKSRHPPTSQEKNINEWDSEIRSMSLSEIATAQMKNSAQMNQDGIASKIVGILEEGQWKGFMQIERELEEKYGTQIDPDELEEECKKLVAEKVIEQDKVGEFYRKRSSP
jgi:hypothetical protein